MLECPVVLWTPFLGKGGRNVEECPEGWTSLTGGCYKFLTEKLTWVEAKEECEKLLGWLIEIVSEEQNDAIYKEGLRQKIDWAWIGLSDTAKEGEWVWTSGKKATFLNWAPKQPSNTNWGKVTEDCAAISLRAKTPPGQPWDAVKKWNDGPCNKYGGAAICQTRKKGE